MSGCVICNEQVFTLHRAWRREKDGRKVSPDRTVLLDFLPAVPRTLRLLPLNNLLVVALVLNMLASEVSELYGMRQMTHASVLGLHASVCPACARL